ncbi:MAG: ABC transporter permease, partial [Limnochordales bacterium]
GRQAEVLVSPVMSAGQLRQVRAGSSLLLGGLGLAALLVSSIAMFTTTLANLAPRTRYIGLSRALGATRGRIVREVVAESAVLAGIGGVVGAALAFPLRKTVFAPLFSSLGAAGGPGAGDVLLAGLAGVALAMAVGAVAALYPAWTVARMAPADAWREGTV